MKKIKYVYAAFLAAVMMITGTVSAKAYLTGVEYNRWYLRWGSDGVATAKLYDNTAGASKFNKDLTLKTDINAYFVGNTSAYASSNYTFSLGSDELNMFIPFLWDAYDYYLLFTMSAATSASSEFTWNPSELSLITYTDERARVENALTFDLYCYCSDVTNGFTAAAPLTELSNYNISWIEATGTGTLPKSIYIRAMVVEVPKSTGADGSSDSAAIIEAIANMEHSVNESIVSGFDSLYNQSQTQHNETLHGYEDSTLNEANNRFTEGADELTAVEDGLTTDSKQYVNDFTSTGFDAGVLLTLGSSLTFIVTWFTNFWNMGGVWTSGLTFCFALSIAFIILKVRK